MKITMTRMKMVSCAYIDQDMELTGLAENHYTADYPDDEVESDDEYGRNPYQYSNNDDATFSDDSEGVTKYRWTKKPAWLRKAEHGCDNDDEDD